MYWYAYDVNTDTDMSRKEEKDIPRHMTKRNSTFCPYSFRLWIWYGFKAIWSWDKCFWEKTTKSILQILPEKAGNGNITGNYP
jgi:hypothetical protein